MFYVTLPNPAGRPVLVRRAEKNPSFIYTIAGSSNGRTSAFGAEYLGSSPSPAAINKNIK